MRPGRPGWAVPPGGGRVLAAAPADDGSWVLGTRARLVAVGDPASAGETRVWAWEQLQSADWDADTGRLLVREVGDYGHARAVAAYSLSDADRLLQLIRERVTASVVLQRQVTVSGARGFRVIARRSPAGGPISWMHEYDEGVDPADPDVHALAQAALTQARAEVGEG